jgi:5-methyltetrahydropteroyltriglutamate--homocysteine methyltransferase
VTRPSFDTFVVGSLPRPRWVLDVIEDRKAGRLRPEQADELLDAAIPSAVRLQERAGLTYVSDGEWRRESYIKVFSEHVDGFEGVPRHAIVPGASPDPCVVSEIRAREPITTDAARFLRDRTSRKTIVTLPSPFILGWRLWDPVASPVAYPTRDDFTDACVPILRAELESLRDLGVDHVQIDEPWLLMLGDPSHRERYGVADFEREIERCVTVVNAMLEGLSGLPTSLHLCHGHFERQRATSGGYDPIIRALGRFHVDRLAMEFAAAESQGVSVLADFPEDKILGLGVIDHCDPRVETPEDVVARAEAALRYVPPERLTLNPDCGFAPGSQNPVDLDEAYLKLTALCAGAEQLRERHA